MQDERHGGERYERKERDAAKQSVQAIGLVRGKCAREDDKRNIGIYHQPIVKLPMNGTVIASQPRRK